MEQLKAKLKKQGGFTMVELLIVVAIIAILVAVSIPMMNSALEKSRHAVDMANERDAVALGATRLLANDLTWTTTSGGTTTATNTLKLKYMVSNNVGYLEDKAPTGAEAVTSKCECTSSTGDHAKEDQGVGNGRTLYVTLTKATADLDATVVASWE